MSAKQADDVDLRAVRYQWYTGYNRENEYDKNPDWAADMCETVVENDKEDTAFSNETTKFYDKFDPGHMWIKSEMTLDLTDTL